MQYFSMNYDIQYKFEEPDSDDNIRIEDSVIHAGTIEKIIQRLTDDINPG